MYFHTASLSLLICFIFSVQASPVNNARAEPIRISYHNAAPGVKSPVAGQNPQTQAYLDEVVQKAFSANDSKRGATLLSSLGGSALQIQNKYPFEEPVKEGESSRPYPRTYYSILLEVKGGEKCQTGCLGTIMLKNPVGSKKGGIEIHVSKGKDVVVPAYQGNIEDFKLWRHSRSIEIMSIIPWIGKGLGYKGYS